MNPDSPQPTPSQTEVARASSETEAKVKSGKILLIACGALAHEIIHLKKHNGWEHLEVSCLPAALHHEPQKIPEAVRKKIKANRPFYEKLYVLYGDCGTGGLLDKVLEEEGGVERIAGPHCFSFYYGNEAFEARSADEHTTFYLTDFFCRFFDKFIWEALALDRRADMVDFVFGNYEKLVFIPQMKDSELEAKARQIADRLGLEYEYEFRGFGDFEYVLKKLDA